MSNTLVSLRPDMKWVISFQHMTRLLCLSQIHWRIFFFIFFFANTQTLQITWAVKWHSIHLLRRSIRSPTLPAIPTSPWCWQALGKGHVLCSHPDKPCLSASGWQEKEKAFDNGNKKGMNLVLSFVDPRLHNLLTRCSLPIRLHITSIYYKSSIYSCTVPGFSAPLISVDLNVLNFRKARRPH